MNTKKDFNDKLRMNKIQAKPARIIALSATSLSYLLLIFILVFETRTTDYTYLFYSAWFFGIVSVISNMILAIKIKIKSWLIVVLGISGIIWLFPPLLMSFYGFPCIFIFLIVAIYLHLKAFQSKKGKTL
ncbi:hypothetical protein MTsPCn5_01770 [Croceitalea sp. MTPC5]|uniref:hypothetical protein n=1 Tax=Croceitalea sp. MTPC5 TaxID=3056565 RepID=UPI002B38F9CB|nr:hypothetical protein MTsPCn5_01770 [Croceitalea sp. MTPC5]